MQATKIDALPTELCTELPQESDLAISHSGRTGWSAIGWRVLIVATYDFIAFFIREITLRRLGLVLAIIGASLGWMLMLVGKAGWLGFMPLDFYSPESFSFLELFALLYIALAIYGSFMAVRTPGLPVFRPWVSVRILMWQGLELVNLSGRKPHMAEFCQRNAPDSIRQGLLDEFQVQ